uniref:hypothetical protein n=1 Tax=Nonomuraea pusilla TaxID=46177 RepID=UPI000A71C726|nr:hypothetical protein [Nonomuraea pusilla]
MKMLPRLLDGRKKKVTEDDIDVALVSGSWKRLAFRAGPHGSTVGKNAYTMCVLTQFRRHLKRRDVHAEASPRRRASPRSRPSRVQPPSSPDPPLRHLVANFLLRGI